MEQTQQTLEQILTERTKITLKDRLLHIINKIDNSYPSWSMIYKEKKCCKEKIREILTHLN
ncbi:hypothetical protein HY643_03370, partial [Candidatus Woesearchaeota archaeon]|nr:hypothetical protein [Candidatus Woesearchaeota archaeon]